MLWGVQVDKIDTTASVLSVNTHLDVLRPAIKNYGGTIEVQKVRPWRLSRCGEYCSLVFTIAYMKRGQCQRQMS